MGSIVAFCSRFRYIRRRFTAGVSRGLRECHSMSLRPSTRLPEAPVMITRSPLTSRTHRPLDFPENVIINNHGYQDFVGAALRGRPQKTGHAHRGAPTLPDQKGAIYSTCIYYIYRPEGRGSVAGLFISGSWFF